MSIYNPNVGASLHQRTNTVSKLIRSNRYTVVQFTKHIFSSGRSKAKLTKLYLEKTINCNITSLALHTGIHFVKKAFLSAGNPKIY